MNLKNITALIVLSALIFVSCSDDELEENGPRGNYENGIIVSHEGNFSQGNASLSYVSYDFKTVENNVFKNMNNSPLGDVAQSISFYNDLAYIVVNGSNKIEVVNRVTFTSVATIDTGLSNPRYVAFSNGKGYVTNWGEGSNTTDDYVAIINLTTNTLETSTISVSEGPEKILAVNNKVYVAHGGGWNTNNIISVIDTATDIVSASITVGDIPNTLQVDVSGNLWVLCSGKASWTGSETAGQLFKVNTSDNSTSSIDFSTTDHPNHLLIEGSYLYYYLSGSVYKMHTTATALPTVAEITGLSFYGMSISQGVLYGVDAGNFDSKGELVSYDLTSNTLINSASVSIGPGSIYFN